MINNGLVKFITLKRKLLLIKKILNFYFKKLILALIILKIISIKMFSRKKS
jgi:hypothetical protein